MKSWISNKSLLICNCWRQPNITFSLSLQGGRFDNGNGLFLPASNNTTKEFEDLRKAYSSWLCDNPRKQEPHITLMHPRNSICTDEIFEKIEKIDSPGKLEFRKVSLIKQVNGGKWLTLKNLNLKVELNKHNSKTTPTTLFYQNGGRNGKIG